MADQEAQKIARDAALQSLVSNAVYLALMLGISLAITKRDTLKRIRLQVEQLLRQEDRSAKERRALADLRREISRLEHSLPRGPETAPDTPGGLYGQG